MYEALQKRNKFSVISWKVAFLNKKSVLTKNGKFSEFASLYACRNVKQLRMNKKLKRIFKILIQN